MAKPVMLDRNSGGHPVCGAPTAISRKALPRATGA